MNISDQPFSPPSQNADEMGQGAADVYREVARYLVAFHLYVVFDAPCML